MSEIAQKIGQQKCDDKDQDKNDNENDNDVDENDDAEADDSWDIMISTGLDLDDFSDRQGHHWPRDDPEA